MKPHKQRVSLIRNYLSTAITLSDDGQQAFQYLLTGTDEFHATDAFDDLNCACNNGDVEEIADAVYNVLLESEEKIREFFGNPWNFQPGAKTYTVQAVSTFEDDALALAQEICK